MRALPLIATVLTALTVTALPAGAQSMAPKLDVDARKGETPPANFDGRWFTSSEDCTYSRTGVPGQRTTWIIVKNPHHVGRPAAHRGCPAML